MILSFFSSRGWESWDVGHRPLLPGRMPVLIDDDLRFEDGPGAPRAATVVNRWLRELPSGGCPAPGSWKSYARAVRAWAEFLAGHGVGLFGSREQLKLAGAGWNLKTQTLAPSPDHPLLGYRICLVRGCAGQGWCRTGSARPAAAPAGEAT